MLPTFPYLLVQDVLTDQLKIEPKSSDEQAITVTLNGSLEHFDLLSNWQEIAHRQLLRELINGKPDVPIQVCFIKAVIRQKILRQLDFASLLTKDDNWELQYRYHGNSYTFTIKQPPHGQELHHSLLVSSQMILEGYTLVEDKGAGFSIYTPSGKKRSLTSHACDCTTFQQNMANHQFIPCDHLRLTKYYQHNRSPFLSLGFAALV